MTPAAQKPHTRNLLIPHIRPRPDHSPHDGLGNVAIVNLAKLVDLAYCVRGGLAI